MEQKNGGSFSKMMGPSISNESQLTFGCILNLHTDTDTKSCMNICISTADYTVLGHSKKKTIYLLMKVKSIAECSKDSILQSF